MIDLMGGFAEPIDHARAFRILLDATAHPGRVLSLSAAIDAPRQLHSTAAATFLVLCDCDTPLWVAPSLHSPPVVDFLRFHTGAPITRDARSARFLLCDSAAGGDALREAHSGCAEYPDRSATIVVQVATLGGGMPVSLTGPGIKDRQTFGPAGARPALLGGRGAQSPALSTRLRFHVHLSRPGRGPSPLHPDPIDGDRLMYVAVKGGEKAIDAAHRLLAEERRGDPTPAVKFARPDFRAAHPGR